MEKVIRGKLVAVLYSPEYGAGWFTWNDEHEELLFHPEIVKMVEEDRRADIPEWVKQNISDSVYTGGCRDLEIAWVPVGTLFKVDEYDGSEQIKFITDIGWITA